MFQMVHHFSGDILHEVCLSSKGTFLWNLQTLGIHVIHRHMRQNTPPHTHIKRVCVSHPYTQNVCVSLWGGLCVYVCVCVLCVSFIYR